MTGRGARDANEMRLINVHEPHEGVLQVGRLRFHRDGTVEGLPDDAPEAARIFAAELLNLRAEHDWKHPEPEITEAVGFYVIPKPTVSDQDSLWDGTIHHTLEAAQASLDTAVVEWGHDAWNYRIVALVPVGEGERA